MWFLDRKTFFFGAICVAAGVLGWVFLDLAGSLSNFDLFFSSFALVFVLSLLLEILVEQRGFWGFLKKTKNVFYWKILAATYAFLLSLEKKPLDAMFWTLVSIFVFFVVVDAFVVMSSAAGQRPRKK